MRKYEKIKILGTIGFKVFRGLPKRLSSAGIKLVWETFVASYEGDRPDTAIKTFAEQMKNEFRYLITFEDKRYTLSWAEFNSLCETQGHTGEDGRFKLPCYVHRITSSAELAAEKEQQRLEKKNRIKNTIRTYFPDQPMAPIFQTVKEKPIALPDTMDSEAMVKFASKVRLA